MKLVDENGKQLPVQVGHLVDRADAIVDLTDPRRRVGISTVESTGFLTPKSARAIAAELLRGASECDGVEVDARSIQQQQFNETAQWLAKHHENLADHPDFEHDALGWQNRHDHVVAECRERFGVEL